MDAPGSYEERFAEAMDDDFNTAKAIALLYDMVKEINKYQRKQETMDQAMALRKVLVKLGNVLGLLGDEPTRYFQNLPGMEDVDGLGIRRIL